jgi:predicted DNA-binding transcriptional regulator AlpA
MRTPTNKTAFHRWLREQFEILETIDRYGTPDFYDSLDTEEIVSQATRLACRFGYGEPATRESPLAVVGRLLAWAEQGDQPDLLSVREVAGRLGVSIRSAWRMASTGEIPAPVKIRGKTKWRSADLQAMIELSPSSKR